MPDSPRRSLETRAYLAALAVMREDPVLAAKVKTWGAYTDDPALAGAMLLNPSAVLMPMIRLTPEPLEDIDTTQDAVTSRMGIRVEIGVDGVDATALMDLWADVYLAWRKLRPMRKTTVLCFIRDECQTTKFRVRTPGYGLGRRREDDNLRFLLGVGQVEIDYLRPC